MPNSEKYVRQTKPPAKPGRKVWTPCAECSDPMDCGSWMACINKGVSAKRRLPKLRGVAPEAVAAPVEYECSYGTKFVEALDELIDARIEYALTRHGPAREYANPDAMHKAGDALARLIDSKVKVRM